MLFCITFLSSNTRTVFLTTEISDTWVFTSRSWFGFLSRWEDWKHRASLMSEGHEGDLGSLHPSHLGLEEPILMSPWLQDRALAAISHHVCSNVHITPGSLHYFPGSEAFESSCLTRSWYCNREPDKVLSPYFYSNLELFYPVW